MSYRDIEKLEAIEKVSCDNLRSADCLNEDKDPIVLRKIWVNYRTDMPNMIGILREYKELIVQLNALENKNITSK